MTVSFGRYPQGASAEVRPIIWEVIGEDEVTLTLASKQIIDVRRFNDETEEKMVPDDGYYYFVRETKKAANLYAESSVKRWLEEDLFRTAFDEEERMRIIWLMLPNKAMKLGARTETEYAASIPKNPSMKDRFYLTDPFDFGQDTPCLAGLNLFTVGAGGVSMNGSANEACGIVPVIKILK